MAERGCLCLEGRTTDIELGAHRSILISNKTILGLSGNFNYIPKR